MRRRRFRTLASQITVLVGVPTAVVLLAVAGLSLFLNQHSRLDTLLQTDAARGRAAARRDRPALSDIVSGPAGVGPVVLTAALRSSGLVDVAALGDAAGYFGSRLACRRTRRPARRARRGAGVGGQGGGWWPTTTSRRG